MFVSCMLQNFSSIFDHSGRDTSMSFVFHTHDLTNISESDSSCNSVSNATRSVNGSMSANSSSLNNGAPLAFRRLPDSKVGSNVHLHRFLTRTIPSQSEREIQVWSDCQHRQGVESVNTRIGGSALFLDSTCFFTCARASQSRHRRYLENL